MKRIAVLLALPFCLLIAGCFSSGSQGTTMPTRAGTPSDLMRVGDKITIRVSGTPDPSNIAEIQIPQSGDITVDLLSGTFHAAGRSPADLAADISAAYRDQKIYTNATVVVLPEERYINVGGDVRQPSRVIFTADSTVMSAINASGGFDEYANRRQVRVIRGSQVFNVDCVKAASDPGADPQVFPGDQIYVPRTIL